MVATYIKKIMHDMCCVMAVCSREIIYIFLVREMSGLVEKFNNGTWAFSGMINVISIKLCMMVLHIWLHLFVTLLVTLTLFQDHSHVKQF